MERTTDTYGVHPLEKQYHFRLCDYDICLLDRVPLIDCYCKEGCPYFCQKPLKD